MASRFGELLDHLPPPLRRATVGVVRPVVRAAIRHEVGSLRFRQWLWYSIAKAFAWDAHPYAVTTRHGVTVRGDTRDMIEQYLYFFGLWEPDLTAWIAGRLQPGDVFVDVGANVGYFTLLASKRVGPEGGVVAIEASPSIHRRLVRNLEINGVTNVRPVLMAAGRGPSVVTVFEGPDNHRGLTTTIAGTDQVASGTVPADSLTRILTPEEVARTRVIKIDVEGAEVAVVEGLAALLGHARPDLEVIVEIGPDRLTPQGLGPEDVFSVFRDAGFRPYAIRNDYGEWRYLDIRDVRPPTQLDGTIEDETDVVFSRVDAPSL